jgi:hypothetical protein
VILRLARSLARGLPAWGLAAAVALAVPARANDHVRFGPHDVATVFAIGKSDDGNQVQYGLRLDQDCRPVGNEPVVGYWREYDRGPGSPLLAFSWIDRTAYNVDNQKVAPRSDGGVDEPGPAVTMTIRAASNRLIEFWVFPGALGGCRAEARTPIAGRPAVLKLIYLQLGGFIFPQWVELRGVAIDDGTAVKERVKP